ncbi:EAL domain-containing protein [Cocleimonas sp. KMM 6892]|uniref:EAL domain-containing protein n=1 Tax=unclassified Cocleimonas TaxID=2639732 RepID=UPI002DBE3269|nr:MULTISPECIES: EAL domain-containing protein [unclassified Cocleimonas]MEB8433526.1 EAL domain-containing protein [Cocleimonas sp. KMM 6892]MEC4716337.1 EAL domain-containing protein [Cocleimonas sp. KMM 6895]MEC4745770.1 EAL domain-containing protein [Cocleimonas sp. KMM 6896]
MIHCEAQSLISLQHELLLSIGTHTSPEALLKEFSFKAIKTLNLKRIHFFQKSNKLVGIRKKSFCIPLSAKDIISENQKLARYYNKLLPTENSFIEEIEHNGSFFYSFGIKNFGYILLERRLKAFDESLIQALIPPVLRFSIAYLSRKQFELNTKQRNKIHEISSMLRLDKQKFESILGAIKDGVIAININKKIFYANDSARAYMDVEKHTDIDKKYYEYFRLLNIDQTEDITQKLERYASKNTSWSPKESVVFKTQSGKTSVCEINVQKIKDKRQNHTGSNYYFVITFHDITETYEMEQTLAWQATHDHLTECLNRSGFEKILDHIVIKNTSHNHALIYMDLDRFKYVNDLGGHLAGDALLKQVAEIMQQEIRESDHLARIGGDEFCIITKRCEIEYAVELSHRIREKVERLRFQWKDNVFTIGISIGVTSIKPGDKDADMVFFKADDACMLSKNNGRNQVTLAQENALNTSKKDPTRQINYINHVNKSLSSIDDSYNFVLYQQQIMAIAEEEKDHIEILLRMEHKNKIILPNAFLPAAERYGKIAAIDLWVVKNSLEYIKHCKDTDVNVNLSGITLSDDCARKQLYQLISEHPEEAKNLCLEITETVAITNLNKCIRFMNNASQYGVSFALDDFGTGVSSFGYLKNLPVKYLKIDGSFIRDICTNEIDQIVVRSITEAAKAMSIQTVAEFVEDAEILRKISEIGVDFAQGYHLNKPERLATYPLPILH